MRQIDLKRILIYIAFAYGIAWSGGLAIYLTGGLANSPYTLVLLTVVYMGAPAIAHVLTRLITHEGWQDIGLLPNLRPGWPYWLMGWFAPGILTLVGLAVYFVLFPAYYDPSLGAVKKLLAAQAGQATAAVSPWLIVISQTITAMLIAPLLNAIPTLGEEFGWRAYLQPKLMPLGGRRAVLLVGVIWGVWHWPVIAMGHNYGLNYPGVPWTGFLTMVWFTLVTGTLLGWAALRAGSVWPAVIGHGALNGIAALGALFVKGQPSPLLGPMPVGWVGSIGFAVVALLIFLWPGALRPNDLQQKPE
jgi:membrane protease YdiL (CAAX protease family)